MSWNDGSGSSITRIIGRSDRRTDWTRLARGDRSKSANKGGVQGKALNDDGSQWPPPDCVACTSSYFLCCCLATATKEHVERVALDLSMDSGDASAAAIVAFFIL